MKSTPLLNTWLALTLLGLALIVLLGCATPVTAPPFVTCGDALPDARDTHLYPTVQIGAQCWLGENLKYLPAVSPTSDTSQTTPYYYVHDYQGRSLDQAKAAANYHNYGALYNWPAAQSACPIGWHLPKRCRVDTVGRLPADAVSACPTTGFTSKALATP